VEQESHKHRFVITKPVTKFSQVGKLWFLVLPGQGTILQIVSWFGFYGKDQLRQIAILSQLCSIVLTIMKPYASDTTPMSKTYTSLYNSRTCSQICIRHLLGISLTQVLHFSYTFVYTTYLRYLFTILCIKSYILVKKCHQNINLHKTMISLNIFQ